MTQSITVKHVLVSVSISISLHSHAMSVSIFFNGLNFSNWYEQVQFHLSVLDLYLTLQVEKLAAINIASSNKGKSHYKSWESSNRLCLCE